MEYAIETFSLTKVFSDWWGRDKIYAVEDLNLRVRYNEVFGLLGPNGSGKTTTLKMLLGLLHPTRGKAIVLGGDGSDPKINARIGFLPEESYLYRYLNARETLDFYGRLFGLPKRVRRMRIEALLDMVGLKAVASRPVGTYSKGMARRIGLAQALINDPDLLILDEPTTGLDPIGTRQIKDLILELKKRGKTILLCSHLLADVEDICDRIAILYGGRIQVGGYVRELLTQTDKRQITTSSVSDSAIEKIKQIIAEEQGECEISFPMDKLETFFVRTVTTAASQAARPASVASTTEISDFLTSETEAGLPRKGSPKDILDKLVSAEIQQEAVSPVQQQSSSAQSGGPEQAKPVETSEGPDERLISELARGQSQAEQAIEGKEVRTEPVEHKNWQQQQGDGLANNETQKSILDQLTSPPDDEADKAGTTDSKEL